MVRWIASLLVIALLAVCGVLAAVVGTTWGANWLAREVEFLSGGSVRLAGIDGSLVGGLGVARLDIRSGTVIVEGERIALHLRPDGLLIGRLSLSTLSASRLTVTVEPGETTAAGPFRLPALATPLPVQVDQLTIDALQVRQGALMRGVTELRFAGAMRGTRIVAHELAFRQDQFAARVAGTVDLRDALPLEATVQWRIADLAWSGAGTLRGDLDVLRVTQWLRVPDSVALEGRIEKIVDAPHVEATATWDSIGTQLAGVGFLQARDGQLGFSGWLTNWQASVTASLLADSLPPSRIQGSVRGHDDRVSIDDLRFDGDFGALSVRGELLPGEPQRLSLALVATGIDTAAFRTGLDGRFSARAELQADLPGAVRLRVRDLEGRLMGRRLAGRGEIDYDDGRVRLRGVSLLAGPNRLLADGEIGERLSGTIALDAPQLAVLWPGLRGSVRAHATLSGSRARPALDLEATGHGFIYEAHRLAVLDVHTTIDRSGRVSGRLRAQGIASGGSEVGDLQATLNGTLSAHDFSAELSHGPVGVGLRSSGSWNGSVLRHRIETANVTTEWTGTWQLNGTPELMAHADAVSLGAHCWEQAPASLCLSQVSWSPTRSMVVGELRDLDLQRLARWWPADFALTGRAQADVSLEVSPAGVAGSADAHLVDATLYYTGGDEPVVTPLQNAQVAARFTPEDAVVGITLAGEPQLRLAINARLRAPFGESAALDAEIRGEVPDIAPLVPLLAPDLDVAEVAGGITLDAAVSGSLQSPQWTGVARLARGAVALPDVGVKFEDVDIALLGDGSATVRVQGSARAGGPLTLAGVFDPLDSEGPQGWLRVRGNYVDAVKLPDRLVKASPDFIVRYRAGAVSVEGSIGIPKADIVVRALPESAASPSPDAVVRDRETSRAGSAAHQEIGGEIAIVLGRNVRLRAFGLDTRLEGTVKLSQGRDGEPQGYGVVNLKDGKFGAYGRELTIERGTLGFSGPLDDPAVNLRASRQVDWEGQRVTAGLVLTGTTSRPESHVFSDPAMSEADALSYLVTGHPLQNTDSSDRSAIAGAALSLGVQQASPITGAIGNAVALDELGVEGSTPDETEVVAGKQLGSDLYLRFTYGVFNRIGSVLARYRLGRNVSIEAASGEAQSLDLVYSVERD
jgi:translocation and assembly module TamB